MIRLFIYIGVSKVKFNCVIIVSNQIEFQVVMGKLQMVTSSTQPGRGRGLGGGTIDEAESESTNTKQYQYTTII